MKQYGVLMIITALAGVSCNSQDVAASKVPAVVVNTLKAQYPNAARVEWEKVGAHYEADFDTDAKTDITVQIDANGKMLMQKMDIGFNDLGDAIKNVLQQQYKNFKVDEVEKIEKGGTVYYQVELDGKGLRSLKDKHLVFSADGREESAVPFWN
jgi:hypothetical protein